ncbi:MAG: transposase [SAR324 cluster bacterium]|nr:transposase [SAR324 cluster bacterium]
MNHNIERRSYSLEFKFEAVRLVTESGRGKTQVAKELDVSRTRIYSWCRTYADQGKSGFKKNETSNNDNVELKRLRIENKRLREEREILKKAAAFFARELK